MGFLFIANRNGSSLFLQTLSSLVLGAIVVGGFTGCTSHTELENRRDNAYDVSGSYKATKASGSEVEVAFEIANESGRHDIVVNLERLSAVTEKERSFIASKKLDADRVFAHFGSSFVLGKGVSRNHLEGGENISDDDGKSSRFYVCTEKFQYDAQNEFRYCLSGSAHKGAPAMDGTLVLHWVHSDEKVVDGKSTTELTTAEVSLSYRTAEGLVFYKQYFGTWSGTIQPHGEGQALAASMTLIIAADSEQKQFLVHSNIGGTSNVVLGGETYKYDALSSAGSVEEMKKQEYPVFTAVFRSEKDPKKTIEVTGAAWSLGDLSGIISAESEGRRTKLATFRLKKN